MIVEIISINMDNEATSHKASVDTIEDALVFIRAYTMPTTLRTSYGSARVSDKSFMLELHGVSKEGNVAVVTLRA